jgi:hypothetical protein
MQEQTWGAAPVASPGVKSSGEGAESGMGSAEVGKELDACT